MTRVIRAAAPRRYAVDMEDMSMTNGCGCGCGHDANTLTAGAPARAVNADLTVDEIKQRPGALETLQRLGINHCCGGHLTLRAAAAAAGVELQTLLEALP
jgi:hypothetical protein